METHNKLLKRIATIGIASLMVAPLVLAPMNSANASHRHHVRTYRSIRAHKHHKVMRRAHKRVNHKKYKHHKKHYSHNRRYRRHHKKSYRLKKHSLKKYHKKHVIKGYHKKHAKRVFKHHKKIRLKHHKKHYRHHKHHKHAINQANGSDDLSYDNFDQSNGSGINPTNTIPKVHHHKSSKTTVNTSKDNNDNPINNIPTPSTPSVQPSDVTPHHQKRIPKHAHHNSQIANNIRKHQKEDSNYIYHNNPQPYNGDGQSYYGDEDSTEQQMKDQVVSDINSDRESNGLSPLTVDSKIDHMAVNRANQVANNYDDQEDEDQMLQDVGLNTYTDYSENIGQATLGENHQYGDPTDYDNANGTDMANECNDVFFNHSGIDHENILDKNAQLIGVGVTKKNGIYYVTVEMGAFEMMPN